ncbi:glycoside hydrolase family 36 protein [Astrocystis sublimbata]|nr:glycoside hydrolase family 36 protein [Astrocystis sublimbata]
MNWRSRIQTFPPLGRVTQVTSRTVSFSAVIEAAEPADEPFDVCIWHTSGEQPSEETRLQLTSSEDPPASLQEGRPGHRLHYYSAEIHIKSYLRFALTFRIGAIELGKDDLGFDDGFVISNVEDEIPQTNDLSTIIHGLNSSLQVRSVASQTPRTQLWTIQAPVTSATGDRSAYADVELGTPWGGFARYFALVRHSNAWLGPRHGKSHFSLDKDALLCSFLSHGGRHLVLLGVGNIENVTTLLRSSNHGPVMVHIRNDQSSNALGMVLAAVGDDCESAIAAAMYHARSLVLFNNSSDDELSRKPLAQSSGIEPQWMQSWYDGLGYCTWNALGQGLTEDKILSAVDSLKKNNININNLIIDDNWQNVDSDGHDPFSYGWKNFDAEPTGFPNGLQHMIFQIRERFPSIENVSVWHALLGYWGGISPHGDIAQQYKTVRVHREGWPVDGAMTVIAETDVARFYDDFYRFLLSCGVSGVKTDAQFMIDNWSSAKCRRDLTNAHLDAWTTASLRHFGDRTISCMSQTPHILFRQQLSQHRPAIPVRNSDDYFPDVPDSHPWHLWANAHNALFTQHLNVIPDWDMFQTSGMSAGYHAASRCISGGPIYITDIPGEHNMELIHQITGLTTRGRTVILRPSVSGKAIDPYTGYEEDSILKIGSYHGRAGTGTPILGIFNTRPHALTEIIPMGTFPGIVQLNKYIVRSHTTGRITPVTEPDSQVARLGVRLDFRGYDILTAYPVTQLDSETNGKISVASLGLIDKMTGAAALIEKSIELLATGRILSVIRLKALGTLGMYISDLPSMSIERDFMVTIQDLPIPPETVAIDPRDGHVLGIDIQKAWKDMKLSSGWSNEVEVKVYFDSEHC